MPDREKVINAYECVITRGKSVCECGKCDYHVKDSAVFFCDNQRVLTDVLALLKEQRENVVTCAECKHAIRFSENLFSCCNRVIPDGIKYHAGHWYCAGGERRQ